MIIPLPSLVDAIERQVLTVSVRDTLMNALSLMTGGCRHEGASHGNRVLKRASCVLAMDGDRLEGILTERDVVKLIASGSILDNIKIEQAMTRNVLTLCEDDCPDLSSALRLLREYRIRHLPVVDALGHLTGLVTPTSIRSVLQPSNMLKLRRVRDVMAIQVHTALGAESVQHVSELMSRNRVSGIVIVDIDESGEFTRPIGILTERDIVQFCVMNLDLQGTCAREVMSSPLLCLHPDDSLAKAHAEMQRMLVRRLVVAGDRDELVGIVTQTSMLQAIDLSEMHSTIGTLKQLVSDRTGELEITNQQLRDEVDKRVAVERELLQINDELEQRVRDRTIALEESNIQLQAEIAERRQAQARLKDYEEHLEQLVARRTAELEVANQALEGEVVERRQVERALFREKELAQVTLQSIGDAVIATDAEGDITYLNARAEAITGWSLVRALARPIGDVFATVREDNGQPAVDPIGRALQSDTIVHANESVVLFSREGQQRAIESTASPIHNREGKPIGAVLVFRDVTESRRLSRKLSHQASHDDLTGLINRREFESQLEGAIASAREHDLQHVLCYMDLDHFKIVNDTCGHSAGDELLRQLAELLRQNVRASDVLARLGGDEFGILLLQCPSERAEGIAGTLCERIAAYRFVCNDKIFTIGASIGLVTIDAETRELAEVLGAADAACYAAKARGRNCIQVYQNDDRDLVRQRNERQWITRIERALAEDRFVLYSQEIVPLPSATEGRQRLRHSEILLRLLDETGSIVPPMAFIPAAERYGLMPAIDRWVVSTFLRQFLSVCRLNEDLPCQRMFAINLSGASLSDERFWQFLETELTRSSLAPQNLCFEITETVAIANLSKVTEFIHRLKQLGCKFALDDFGSGMSSFSYLKTLPVDYLKIDGSFIKSIRHNAIDRVMVESFIDISHAMDIQTIAEFVENADILSALIQLGADYAQGYGIAQPAPLRFSEWPALLLNPAQFYRCLK